MLGATLCPLLLLVAMLGSVLASGPGKDILRYSNKQEAIHCAPPEKMQCYYQGYIKGYPTSVVTLSTCSGLRGILQFENVSYGIEPLEHSLALQHIIYKLGNEENKLTIFNKNSRNLEMPTNYGIFINEKAETPVKQSSPLYLEMNIVVDKALVFSQLQVTIVLSSLELWSDKNRIPTVGEADELLHQFLEWKQYHLTLRPHDVAYLFMRDYGSLKGLISAKCSEHLASAILRKSLRSRTLVRSESGVTAVMILLSQSWGEKASFVAATGEKVLVANLGAEARLASNQSYNEYPNYVGATYPGKMCVTRYSAGITMYPKNMTLEAFSVVVTQMLGLSLGISYDDPAKCPCSEATCIMNPRAMQSAGVKVFSNCSLSDFERFKSNAGAKCLQNKPQMQINPRPICGNGKVEGNEICDCGSPQ
ncbi:hypothetical protein U0070_025820, partial [Myodes glareolus]